MKIDLYTKTVLSLIAIFLAIVALKPLVPGPVSAADGKFSHVQYSNMQFFDERTGDLWLLEVQEDRRGTFHYLGRVESLGKFRRGK